MDKGVTLNERQLGALLELCGEGGSVTVVEREPSWLDLSYLEVVLDRQSIAGRKVVIVDQEGGYHRLPTRK